MSLLHDTAPSYECDCCGAMVPREQIAIVIAYGIETAACCACRGVDPETYEPAPEKRSPLRRGNPFLHAEDCPSHDGDECLCGAFA